MSQDSDRRRGSQTGAFDAGPLGWVKDEIDAAMGRAIDALAQFAAAPAEGTIKAAQTHLHQAHGALHMVGLEGVTRLSEELEGLLADLQAAAVPRSADNFSAAEQAFHAILAYLERLMTGSPDQPLRLYGPYCAVLAARGRAKQADPVDLYYPGLSPRTLPVLPEAGAGPAQEGTQHLREQRANYQRALLKWLRNDSSGIGEMRAVIAALGAAPGAAGSQRAFGWVAQAFFEALAANALPQDLDARRLCNRIEQQLKRLVEGSQNVAERLMRETLYCVARAAPGGDLVGQVKSAYQLADTIPTDEPGFAAVTSLDLALRPAREQVTRLKTDWHQYAATGNVTRLSAYRQGVAALQGHLERLSAPLASDSLGALTRALDAIGAWLDADRDKMSEAVALEVATALLLAQRSLDDLPASAEDLPRQVELVCARLDACRVGKLLRTAPEMAPLEQMSRQAQERLVLSQVIGDMRANLRTIEQVLDGFFRDPSQRAELSRVDQPMQQVLGAFETLGEQRAHDALAAAAGAIGRFNAIDYEPRQEHFEAIAQTLSGLGVYIESLAAGNPDFDAAMNPIAARVTATSFEETQMVPSVELQLVAQQREAERLFEEWKQRPDDRTIRIELQRNLQAIQADADRVADSGLAGRAAGALDLLQRADALYERTGTMHAPDAPDAPGAAAGDDALRLEHNIAEAIDGLSRSPARPATPARAAAMPQANDETVDAELIAIYLEEADLVLAAIRENLGQVRVRRDDARLLGSLRRSFHTLKGSGRMVGLTRLGDAAWAVEQTMNLWLEEQRGATDALLDLIDTAHHYFADAVAQLRRDGQSPDGQALVRIAESVRRGTPGGVGAAVIPHADPATPGEAIAPAADGGAIDRPPPEAVLPAPGTDDTDYDFSALEPDEPEAPARTGATGSILIGEQEVSATLFDLFANEARAHLSAMKQEYEMLIQHGIVTDALMRAAHTLGGIAGTVQIDALRALGHSFERALQQLSASELSESEQELVREALEEIESMVDDALALRMPEARVDLAARLEQAALPAHEDSEMLPEEEAVLEREADEDLFDAQPADDEIAGWDIAAGPDQAAPPGAVADAPSAASGARQAAALNDAAERRRRRIDDDLDAQLLPVFLEEAHELIPLIGSALRDWRANPRNPGLSSALQRLLHTLKGSGRMAGAMSMGELTHHMETRIDHALTLPEMPAALFDDLETSVDRMGMLYERLSRPEAATANAARGSASTVETAAAQPAGTLAPADAGAISARGDARPARPPPAAPHGLRPAEEPARAPMLRVQADAIDRLVNQAGEIAIVRSRIEGEMRSLKVAMQELTDNVQRLRAQLREIEIQADTQMQSRQYEADDAREQFDPLEFDRFTRFQEVTRLMAESVNDVHTVHQNLTNAINGTDTALLAQARLNRDLQHDLMQVRMVPFGSLSERLYRVVRQSAKALGKRVNLEIRGAQVELDRSVLERITAPLEHMLRNAVSHGLELPADRLAQGKPEFGEIRLELAQEGNEVQFALSDDGAGIDIGRARAKAVAMGLTGEDESLSEIEIADFIFLPGFSTAQEVTQISGRGIGMDVVKSEIASLGGRVELHSVRGKGLRIVVFLPLTLAVTHALLVRAATRPFAIPSVMVEQVRQYRPAELAQLAASSQAEWQNRRYPFHYLPRLLGDHHAAAKERRYSPVLFLRSGANALALHVDEIVGKNQEVVVKAIGPQLARLPGITGATVLGSGDIVLIINPVLLAERAGVRRAPAPEAIATDAAGAAVLVGRPPQRIIMVVDDSLTVRKFTGRLLSREGYEVVVAKDGVEAMEKLQDVLPDLMLVDIEMPRMDGFALTRTVRADTRLKATPIIMISSRTADKHQTYAHDIGVDAFFGKPYQEDRLLEKIASLLAAGRARQYRPEAPPPADADAGEAVDAPVPQLPPPAAPAA